MVDDASTDRSADIAREFCAADSRFRLVSHDVNCGMSVSRNTALDLIKSPLVTFVDSDDLIHPQFLENGLQLAENNPNSIVCFGFRNFTSDDVRISQYGNKQKIRHLSPEVALCKLLFQVESTNSSAWGKLYPAKLFAQVRFVPGIAYEDLEIIDRLVLTGREVIISDQIMYFYRQRGGSIMHTWAERRLDVLQVTEMIEERLSGNEALLRAARDRRFSANFNMLLLLRKHGRKDSDEADACRRQIRRLRRSTLFNRHTRLKNKLGALLSYLVLKRL